MNAKHVVSQHEWLEARLELLAKEKAFDKQRDEPGVHDPKIILGHPIPMASVLSLPLKTF